MSSWHERWTWHSETTANNGTLEGVSIHQGQRRSSMHLWWGRIKSRNPNVSHKALGPECRRACKTRHCDAWIVHSWIATSHLQLLQATCKVFEDWYDKESRVFPFLAQILFPHESWTARKLQDLARDSAAAWTNFGLAFGAIIIGQQILEIYQCSWTTEKRPWKPFAGTLGLCWLSGCGRRQGHRRAC